MKNFLFIAVAFLGFGSVANAGVQCFAPQAIVVNQPQFIVNPFAVQVQAQAFAFQPQRIVVQPQRIVVRQPQRIVIRNGFGRTVIVR